MMMTPNEEILDRFVRHLHYLERYKAAEIRRIVTLLNKADRDLVARISERLASIGRGAELSKTETDRLTKLLVEIRSSREELAYTLTESASDELVSFAKYEADYKAKTITKLAGVKLGMPSERLMRAVVTARPFRGRLLREWYQELTADQAKRVTDAIRIGVVEGQTTDQIVRAIRGTRAARYQDGILEITRREAATIVRTSIGHVSNSASEQLYRENDDIIEGVQWVATLDGRTTTICASRDGNVYAIGKGPRPPAHWNCRSTTIPYLGAQDGTRASIFGPIPRETTYEGWLKKQPAAFQNEVLGTGKAKLFREGMKLERFVDPTGKEYSLAQLIAADAA